MECCQFLSLKYTVAKTRRAGRTSSLCEFRFFASPFKYCARAQRRGIFRLSMCLIKPDTQITLISQSNFRSTSGKNSQQNVVVRATIQFRIRSTRSYPIENRLEFGSTINRRRTDDILSIRCRIAFLVRWRSENNWRPTILAHRSHKQVWWHTNW